MVLFGNSLMAEQRSLKPRILVRIQVPDPFYERTIEMNFRNKPRKKRSKIWEVDRDELQLIINKSNSFADVLRQLNIDSSNSNYYYSSLRMRIKKENLDISNIPKDNKGRKFNITPKINNDLIFVENSQHSRSSAKRRIIKENLIPYTCFECKTDSKWNGKNLVLVLDHINGVSNDHRLENLRFLCPNCNSQTNTFCGKNKRRITLDS